MKIVFEYWKLLKFMYVVIDMMIYKIYFGFNVENR